MDDNSLISHQLERKVVTALERGIVIDLVDLGGVPALHNARDEIALSPLLPEFIRISLSGLSAVQPNDLAISKSLVLFWLEEMTDEFVVQESLDILENYRPLPPDLEEDCFLALLNAAQQRQKPGFTRALFLEGAFRFTVDAPARKHQLLTYLLGVSEPDNPEYLQHLAKILGVAYSAWREPALVPVLQCLSENESAASEAFFELGMATLAEALDAGDGQEALNHFAIAKEQFELSMQDEEDYPEAEVYLSCIEIILAFHAQKPWRSLNTELERLKQALIIYSAWNASTLSPAWASARNMEMANWHTLVTKLEALSRHLAEPSWFEPAIVIEQTLLQAYAANRTIFKKRQPGVIEILVRPRIEGSLINAAGLLYTVWKWLEIHEGDMANSSAACELKLQLTAHLGEVVLGKASVATLDNFRAAVPALREIPALSPVEPTFLQQVMADQLELQRRDCNPVLESILESCAKGISFIDDYQKDSVRKTFHTLLFQSLKYLETRMDLTRSHEPRMRFLFEPEPSQDLPVEKDLQQDYFYFMDGNISAGDIRVEMSDVASGRADVYFSFGAINYVAEIKRELDDCSFESLRVKYLGQAAEYQNTNVKLGFLLVLDLTKKPHGSGDMKSHVKVEILDTSEVSGKRAVVVIRIPGRRKTPSEVKLKSTASFPSSKVL